MHGNSCESFQNQTTLQLPMQCLLDSILVFNLSVDFNHPPTQKNVNTHTRQKREQPAHLNQRININIWINMITENLPLSKSTTVIALNEIMALRLFHPVWNLKTVSRISEIFQPRMWRRSADCPTNEIHWNLYLSKSFTATPSRYMW